MRHTLNLNAALRCDDITANQRLLSVFEAFNHSLGPEWVGWIQKTPPPYRSKQCPSKRPCRYFGCRYHLALERLRSGNLKLTHPELILKQLPFTCLWDAIDAFPGGMSVDQIASVINVNREIISRILYRAMRYPQVKMAMRPHWEAKRA